MTQARSQSLRSSTGRVHDGQRMWQSRRGLRTIAAVIVMCLPAAAVAQSCASSFSMRDLKTLTDGRPNNTGASVPPLHPAVARLGTTIVKIFACQGLVNHYAAQIGLPNDIVQEKPYERIRDNSFEMHFTNKVHGSLGKDVCGSIRFEVPLGLPGHDATTNFESWWNRASRLFSLPRASDAENDAYKAISKGAFETTINSLTGLYTRADNLIHRFLPEGAELPMLSTEILIANLRATQDRIGDQFNAVVRKNSWDEAKVAHFIEVAGCHALLPVAHGPDEETLATYTSAFNDYIRFKTFLDRSMPP